MASKLAHKFGRSVTINAEQESFLKKEMRRSGLKASRIVREALDVYAQAPIATRATRASDRAEKWKKENAE